MGARTYGRWVGGLVLAMTGATASGQAPVDRFLKSVETNAAVPAEARDLIRQTWAKCDGCDAAEFLTQGLAVLSPRMREGLDAYSAEEHENCIGIMGELRGDDDPFVATHAAVYEIKSLVAVDRLVDAGQRIEALLEGTPIPEGKVANFSYFAPEIAFLRGFCRLGDLQYEAAGQALSQFLKEYPDATPRLSIAAEQMLGELRNRRPEHIGEVVDLMNYSGRQLKVGDAGETVRGRQDRIIEILDKLIKDQEEQEKQNSQSSGGKGGQSGQQQPSNPMPQSRLPAGGPPEGPMRDRRKANPAEMWGAMPPGERERILQALRDNFPGRYRQLVEQYYEELAKKP